MRQATSLSPICTVHSALSSTVWVTHSEPAQAEQQGGQQRELPTAASNARCIKQNDHCAVTTRRLADEELGCHERGRDVAAARFDGQHLAACAVDEATADIHIF